MIIIYSWMNAEGSGPSPVLFLFPLGEKTSIMKPAKSYRQGGIPNASTSIPWRGWVPWSGVVLIDCIVGRSALALILVLVGALLGEPNTVVEAAGMDLPVPGAPCVRLFHSGGDVGCRSPSRSGTVGPLFLARTMSDIEELEGLASRGSAVGAAEDPTLGDEGLVVAMATGLFNSSSLARLSATGILGGVLVVDCDDKGGSGAPAKGYSPAVATPQVGCSWGLRFPYDEMSLARAWQHLQA